MGAALVAGYLIDLRPADRSPVPIGFAVVIVLVRAATAGEYVAVMVCVSTAAVALRSDAGGLKGRAIVSAEYLAAGLGAGATFQTLSHAVRGASTGFLILLALGAAAVVEIAIADLVVAVREHRVAPLRARGADIALISSGILMAVGYGGISGRGRLGLWGPALFAIPLLAAWYSFELGDRTRRTFHQTVHALGVAPELGGLVRTGHVERVAQLAVAVGRELGVSEGQLADLETAAWLHHLGAVCLDDPLPGQSRDPADVARAGAEMLRASHALASAGDIVAAEPKLHRPPDDASERPSAIMGQVLKVASAYDELTEGDDSHAAWAVEALFTGPAYVYDGRVLTALEQVLLRSGLLRT